jgi:hypothetical protein
MLAWLAVRVLEWELMDSVRDFYHYMESALSENVQGGEPLPYCLIFKAYSFLDDNVRMYANAEEALVPDNFSWALGSLFQLIA